MPAFYQVGGVGGRILSGRGFARSPSEGNGNWVGDCRKMGAFLTAFLLFFRRCLFLIHFTNSPAARQSTKTPQSTATNKTQPFEPASGVGGTSSGTGGKSRAIATASNKTFISQIFQENGLPDFNLVRLQAPCPLPQYDRLSSLALPLQSK